MSHESLVSNSVIVRLKSVGYDGRVLDDTLSDQDIDAILESFHGPVYSKDDNRCVDGDCPINSAVKDMLSLFDSIESTDLLHRMDERLNLMMDGLEQERADNIDSLISHYSARYKRQES